MTELEGQRVVVMGLGRHGGGVGVCRWLADQGADVLVTDLAPADRLSHSLSRIRDLVGSGAVSLRLGEHNVGDFTTADLVVANPAVPRPWDNRFLRAADAAGARVTTEIALLVERLDRRRVIGVTGTAGKSTTVSLIARILEAAGCTAHAGGNIGGSLLEALPEVGPRDWAVLELSSAMLHWLGDERLGDSPSGWAPAISLITNLYENHLDWHGSFAHYRKCKLDIWRFQRAGDVSLCGWTPDDQDLRDAISRCPATPIEIPLHDESDDDLPLPPHGRLALLGDHNRQNARLALATARAALELDGIPLTDDLANRAMRAVCEFDGLPHRLRPIAEHAGVRFIDDSKSTTPEATVRAIEAIAQTGVERLRIHLIAGGYDKGADLGGMVESARGCAGLYAIGATSRALVELDPDVVTECGELDRAVFLATSRAGPGDVVLLSPGCASWDQFDDFEHRGRAFAEAVHRLNTPGEATSSPARL